MLLITRTVPRAQSLQSRSLISATVFRHLAVARFADVIADQNTRYTCVACFVAA